MSSGWSLWVMFLVVLNMGITFFLYLWAPRAKIPTRADGTTGHVWAHGTILEGLKRLPTWWVVFSGAMFASAFVHLVLYPGFGNHKGTLNWTSHGQLAQEVAANQAKLEPLMERFRLYPVEKLAGDPQAVQMGKTLFEDNCEACHQRSGKGNILIGAPNLTDNDWLYGGAGKDITTSIHDGRQGHMPAWTSRLSDDQIHVIAAYVYKLSHPDNAEQP